MLSKKVNFSTSRISVSVILFSNSLQVNNRPSSAGKLMVITVILNYHCGPKNEHMCSYAYWYRYFCNSNL